MKSRYNSSLADWSLLQHAALLISVPVLVLQIQAQTQATMNAQAHTESLQADAELNKTYEELLTKLFDAERKEKVKQSQRAWLAFRDAEAAFAADQARVGSKRTGCRRKN